MPNVEIMMKEYYIISSNPYGGPNDNATYFVFNSKDDALSALWEGKFKGTSLELHRGPFQDMTLICALPSDKKGSSRPYYKYIGIKGDKRTELLVKNRFNLGSKLPLPEGYDKIEILKTSSKFDENGKLVETSELLMAIPFAKEEQNEYYFICDALNHVIRVIGLQEIILQKVIYIKPGQKVIRVTTENGEISCETIPLKKEKTKPR